MELSFASQAVKLDWKCTSSLSRLAGFFITKAVCVLALPLHVLG